MNCGLRAYHAVYTLLTWFANTNWMVTFFLQRQTGSPEMCISWQFLPSFQDCIALRTLPGVWTIPISYKYLKATDKLRILQYSNIITEVYEYYYWSIRILLLKYSNIIIEVFEVHWSVRILLLKYLKYTKVFEYYFLNIWEFKYCYLIVIIGILLFE